MNTMSEKVSPTTSREQRAKRFNLSYVSSCAGTLRLLIIIMGIFVLILACIGTPHDLNSFNNNSGSSGTSGYYGNGVGFIAEPLTAGYLATLVVTSLVSIVFVIALAFETSHRIAVKINRPLHLLAALLLLVGICCGAAGSYYFWRNCCRVRLVDTAVAVTGIKYGTKSTDVEGEALGTGYVGWCRCTYTYSNPGGTPELKVADQFYFSRGQNDIRGQLIHSAWPHHFTVHIISLVAASLNVIFYFLAVCIA